MAHQTSDAEARALQNIVDEMARAHVERVRNWERQYELMTGHPYKPPVYTRRQRLGFKIHHARTRLAQRIAPWLDEDY